MERDHSRMMSDHQSTIQHLQKKTDTSIEIMKQEHTASASRVRKKSAEI